MLIYDIIPPQKNIRNSIKFVIRRTLKPTLSFWLVIFLLLQMIAGVLFFPPIKEARANPDPEWLSGFIFDKIN